MSTELETYIINELQGGFTRSGLSTNEWSVSIISQEFEITETTYTRAGDPVPKTPLIRVSPVNCLDEKVTSTLKVNTKEKETTTWTINSEVALTEELEVSAAGDILVAEAEAKAKVGVTFKVGGSVSGTSEKEVSIDFEQPVPVKPKHRTIMELGIFTTPVEGVIKGFRKVRVRYQYDLDVPFQFFDETHSGTALIKVPFQVDFKSEVVSYIPRLRDEAVDCETAFSGLIPGQEGYSPFNHPLFGERRTETRLALATRIIEPLPDTGFGSRADRIISVAAAASSPVEMLATLGWSESELPTAKRIFTMVDSRVGGLSAELLSGGVLNTELLEKTAPAAALREAV